MMGCYFSLSLGESFIFKDLFIFKTSRTDCCKIFQTLSDKLLNGLDYSHKVNKEIEIERMSKMSYSSGD